MPVIMSKGQQAYQCPRCEMISYNENDIKHKYCGNCHEFEHLMELKSLIECKHFREKVSENKVLSKEEEEKLYNHLKSCESCKSWILSSGDLNIDFNIDLKKEKN